MHANSRDPACRPYTLARNNDPGYLHCVPRHQRSILRLLERCGLHKFCEAISNQKTGPTTLPHLHTSASILVYTITVQHLMTFDVHDLDNYSILSGSSGSIRSYTVPPSDHELLPGRALQSRRRRQCGRLAELYLFTTTTHCNDFAYHRRKVQRR